MKEVTFIRRNIEKWKEAEGVVEQATNSSPDRLADVYTDLTADLAFRHDVGQYCEWRTHGGVQ